MMKKASAVRKTSAPKRPQKTKGKGAPRETSNRLLHLIVAALEEKKAVDVRIFDVSRLSSLTDYLVLATVLAEPHLRALRVELEKVIDAEGARIVGIDTAKASGWTVVDAFDVMVHLFTAENRNKYRLDTLWKDAEEILAGELLAKIT